LFISTNLVSILFAKISFGVGVPLAVTEAETGTLKLKHNAIERKVIIFFTDIGNNFFCEKIS
jgi:hypothetical protein